MKESAIEAAVCKFAIREFRMKCYKLTTTHAPDRLFVLPGGRCFFIEFKTQTGKLRPGQEEEIRRLRDLDQTVHVVRSVEDGRWVVRCEAEK